MRHCTRHASGFTLIEVVLASVATALLMFTLYASMTIAFKARRTAADAVELPRAASIALDMISRDLESALSPNGVLAGPFIGSNLALSGNGGDQLEFFTLATDDLPEAGKLSDGMARVVLSLDTSVSPPILARRITHNLLSTSASVATDQVLCRNVTQLLFRYFDGTDWVDSWDSTQRDNVLPFAVEVTIELAGPNDASGKPGKYRVSKIVPLSCAKPPTETTAAGRIQ